MLKLAFSLGLAFVALLVVSGVHAATSHRALPAETLSGTKLIVPGDLPEKPILFVIGFSKASRGQASAWSRVLEERLSTGTATVYSVSVIEDVPGFLRGLVASSIRHGVPESLHDRFLLISEKSTEWKDMTAYVKPDDAYLVLMDAAREVVWRASGPVTEKKLHALTMALHLLVSPNREVNTPRLSPVCQSVR